MEEDVSDTNFIRLKYQIPEPKNKHKGNMKYFKVNILSPRVEKRPTKGFVPLKFFVHWLDNEEIENGGQKTSIINVKN